MSGGGEIPYHVTEKQLIKRCCQNDRAAQQALYELYAPKMLGLCVRYVKDREVAQDLMHDGFITIFAKVGDFRQEGSFEGWMRRIFVNTVLGYLRRNRVLDFAVPVDENVALESGLPSALETIQARELMQCVDTLPDGYRLVLNLFAVEGYSHREVATMLGISEGTSRSQYARAKGYLQKQMKKRGLL